MNRPLPVLLALVFLSSAQAEESRSDRIRDRINTGIQLAAAGDLDGALEVLREADALATEKMNLKGFEANGFELTAEQLAFGEEQLRQMIADRPKMAGHITQQDGVYKWAVRQFAGESTPNKVYWSNEVPPSSRANHVIPKTLRAGKIRIAPTFAGEELDFEGLWSCAIFELLNISNAEKFKAIHDEALEGKLERDIYVAEYFHLEFIAAARTRRFYLSEFSQILRREKLGTNPSNWYVNRAYLGDWWACFCLYRDRSRYPWVPYGQTFDAIMEYRARNIRTLREEAIDLLQEAADLLKEAAGSLLKEATKARPANHPGQTP